MSASLVFGLLRFLPPLIEVGLPVAQQLIGDIRGKVPAGESPVADYAMKAIELVPALQAAGKAVEAVAILKRTNDEVGAMIREGRGPTPEERRAQAERIAALDQRFDAAAKG